MEIKPPPRLVALDTQIFDKYNFNYKSRVFQTLIELVQQEKVKVLLTSITLDEMKAHITEGAEQASEAIKQAVKDLKNKHFKKQKNTPNRKIQIAANSESLSKFKEEVKDPPNFEQINKELLDQLKNFLDEIDFEMIKVDRVSVAEVFEKYFSSSPPFGVGKKKYEFPDAFVLLTLKQEAKDRKKIIYLVSEDSDWKNFCSSSEDLCLVEKLDELLAKINQETDSDEFKVCYDLFDAKVNEIKSYIGEKFANLDFSIDISGSSLIEWGSEEVEVEVNDIDIINSSLVNIDNSDKDQPSVIFELVAEVNYAAKVSYESLEFATYDREDDLYYGTETINTVLTESIKLSVEVTLILFRDKDYSLCDAQIYSVDIDPNNTLGEIVIDTGFGYDYY